MKDLNVPKSEGPLSGKRGLVIDDEFLIALDLQEILEGAGAQITCAGSVDKALEALRGEAYDFGVLDLHLGGDLTTGLAVAAGFAEHGIPFIFLSGMRSDERPAGGFPQAALIEKPYQPSALLATIAKLLG
jgi:DNA-binding response OmpR family regulator